MTATLTPDEVELVNLYAEGQSRHAWHVVAAFVLAGVEPPYSAAYTAKQSQLIQAHYDKYDPNGSRRAAKQERDESGEVC